MLRNVDCCFSLTVLTVWYFFCSFILLATFFLSRISILCLLCNLTCTPEKYIIARKTNISCISTNNIDTNNTDFSEVYLRLVDLDNIVESNPDVIEIINTLEQEFQQQQDDSRFIIFVKRRATAKALAKRLPQNLKSLYLTGQRSKDACGMYITFYNLV